MTPWAIVAIVFGVLLVLAGSGVGIYFAVRSEEAEEVSCGGHKAKDCESCTQGHGATWCNGDCVWEEASQKCVKKR